jgi:serine/threonine protein kinase
MKSVVISIPGKGLIAAKRGKSAVAISCFCEHCGAENASSDALCCACQQPLSSRESGGLLNQRYAVLAEIGSGGFGAVYKARDIQEDQRLVAIKQINLKGISAQEIIDATDAFNREAEILTSLSHPLLPHIFDRFSDSEHWYLVMNFIAGETLDDYLQYRMLHLQLASTGLPLPETIKLGLKICDALRYLHSQQPPVIFRDLKPGNIMRTPGGQLYLIDFGIARRFKPGKERDTIPFGSPGFAAPEQYGRAQTTPQADIYSLGALLYCLISGDDPSAHPFQFPSLRRYSGNGISEMDTLIQRMVSLAPAQRPADIAEVQAELQHIQQLYHSSTSQPRIWLPPQGQTPPSASGQQHIFSTAQNNQLPARKTSRRRVLTTALLVGGALAAGGALVTNNHPQPSISTVPYPNQSAQNAAQAINSTPQEQATATATNQQAVVPLNGAAYWSSDLSYAALTNLPENQIELYRTADRSLVRSIQIPAGFSAPMVCWSPDNRKIIAQSSTGIIKAWDSRTGQIILTCSSAAVISYSSTIIWSPDGNYCAFVSNKNGQNTYLLTVLHVSNGTQIAQIALPLYYNDYTKNTVAWSPDGKYITFPAAAEWTDNGFWQVALWERETGIIQKENALSGISSGDITSYISSLAWSPEGTYVAVIADYALWLCTIATNESARVLTNLSTTPNIRNFSSRCQMRWSPDQKYLAILTDQNLTIWDAFSGRQVPLTGTSKALPENIVTFAWGTFSRTITIVDDANAFTYWVVG